MTPRLRKYAVRELGISQFDWHEDGKVVDTKNLDWKRIKSLIWR